MTGPDCDICRQPHPLTICRGCYNAAVLDEIKPSISRAALMEALQAQPADMSGEGWGASEIIAALKACGVEVKE